MQWTNKQMARLKKEKRNNLKKKRERSYKMILNALIAANKSIMQGTVTRNLNKIK
jgi:hypothetical protein